MGHSVKGCKRRTTAPSYRGKDSKAALLRLSAIRSLEHMRIRNPAKTLKNSNLPENDAWITYKIYNRISIWEPFQLQNLPENDHLLVF